MISFCYISLNPELKMGEKKKMRRKRLTYLQTRKVSIQQTERKKNNKKHKKTKQKTKKTNE